MRRILISAARKSSGKTTLSVGLAAALAATGRRVQPFKKGPDYIDPMWLAEASGRPCYNLDFNTQSNDEILETCARQARNANIALVEGNKGLHDGIDLLGADSTAALAKLIEAPVALVVDASGITRGVAPLVKGQVDFDPDITVAGVIFNRVASSRQETKLRQALQYYSDVEILGAVGRCRTLVRERHLGLTTPGETVDSRRIVEELGRTVSESVDIERVAEIAAAAPPLSLPRVRKVRESGQAPVRIGIARDAAFGFYYPDDLEALHRAGAELVAFSPLSDKRLPPVNGLFIGGGFPETHLPALEANAELRGEILRAARGGMPVYAECGGLMYLGRSISWRGRSHRMVGHVPADTEVGARPQGRGLMVLEETAAAPWPAAGPGPTVHGPIPAHEFHYGRLVNLDPAVPFAYRVVRGHGIDGDHDGLVVGNTLASFAHLRDTSRHHWAARFVAFVRQSASVASVGGLQRSPGAD